MASDNGHRSTFATVRRAWGIFREEGLRTFWFRLLGKTVYRRLGLFERSLQTPIPEAVARVPILIGELEGSAVAEYLRFRPGTAADAIERRFEAGHVCFTARWEGRLVAVSWMATGRVWQDYLCCELPMTQGDVYHYDSFTSADCRGHGIAPALQTAVMRHYRAGGYRRMLRVIWPENRASLRVAAKTGWRPCGVMRYVRLGPWGRHFHSF